VGRRPASAKPDVARWEFNATCGKPFAGDSFGWLLFDPIAALCNGNDPDWRRYICGAEARYIRLERS
jgi:hypothetical protein